MNRWFLLFCLLFIAGCSSASRLDSAQPASSEDEEPRALVQPVTVTPEHPAAGQPVTITYHPEADAAHLKHPATVELVYRGGTPAYRVVPMTREGDRWTRTIHPDKDAGFVRFYVQSDSAVDKNGGAWWSFMTRGTDGRPLRGAHAERASFYRHTRYKNTRTGDSLAIVEYDRELERYPDNVAVRAERAALKVEREPDSARAAALKAAALGRLDKARERYADGAEKLREVKAGYYALDADRQARALVKALAERDPEGPEAENAARKQATADSLSVEELRQQAQAFEERFPQSVFTDRSYQTLFERYEDEGDVEGMLWAADRWARAEKISPPHAYSTIARALSKAGRYEQALWYGKRSVEESGDAPGPYVMFLTSEGYGWAPAPRTPRERREADRIQRGTFRGRLGWIYYQKGDVAKAEDVLARAAREAPGKVNLQLRLAQAYKKNGKVDSAYAALERVARAEPALPAAQKLFRRVYARKHGASTGVEDTLAALGRGALMRERIGKEAPALELTTLSGDSLRAESLKGKVLVLDFWGTWCGPCKVAFPHLQAAYEKYNDRSDVAFLAVNTSWNDTKAKARAFLEKNEYTVPAYWDAKAQLTRGFDIRGIPTTILIGKGGNVQFRELGFGANDEEVYMANLSMRIDMLLEEDAPDEGAASTPR